MRKVLTINGIISLTLLLLLGGCVPVQPIAPIAQDGPAMALPPAVEYDLGEATVVQALFPDDSRFHNMPVRLNGLIAVPTGEGGPYPVAVILHGTHPGCPVDETGVDRWPCDPALEQPNYRGFGYLVSDLAARGYVALSININAEYTFGFGEPIAGERLEQLLDLHLQALAEAAAGGANAFGVELDGRADVHRLALLGHSRGGEAAVSLANDPEHPLGAEGGAYGPAAGTLAIAAAVASFDPAGGSRVPNAIVLPACDGDVISQDGQFFLEAARLAPAQEAWVTSAWLEQANHNNFNTILRPDQVRQDQRPDCTAPLAPDLQRQWLADYAGDFLEVLFSHDPAVVRAATTRMGMNAFAPAPAELYGLPGRVAVLAPANNRLPLLVPASAEELTASPAGGRVVADGIPTHFCPEGFYFPAMLPGSEPCRRNTVEVPGQPAHAVVDWDEAGGALRFALPPGVGLLNFFDAISLRAAVDPMSPRNAQGATQGITIRLTDGSGNTASVATRADEPALQFPQGMVIDEDGGNAFFTGRAPLTTIRVPLADFAGVNLMDIAEVALVFDRTPSGTLWLADVALVRSPIGAQETLDAPPSAELIAAAEAGDVEAMRQLANLYRPKEAMGVQYGNLERAVFWYRQACAAGYANAQVDFYQFARTFAETTSDAYLAEAIRCLEDAIRQGHRSAIVDGAFRAAFIDQDFKTGFFLYALLEDTDPDIAAQRWSFADQLTQAEIDEAEAAAAAWRAENQVKDYDDFFAAVDSPFRQVAPPSP